ncbi:MAG: DJ-1/PfpI family protein [Christensenellales bacterium]
MIYVFLANGFEEIEALATVDIIRRAELNVKTVGVGGKMSRVLMEFR